MRNSTGLASLGLLLVVAVLVPSARGHGRLIKPPSRGSMWRFGFDNPPNYTDNQLFCGGVTVQHIHNGGLCGMCGDPYNGVRQHEAGGMYANGIIVETYMEEDTIEVDVDITANHKGWFEFRLCANNDPSRAITQECLDEHLLRVADSGETRVYIGTTVGDIRTYLSLPAGLTCTQCVLQWKYNTGNSWGTDPGGNSCLGCGNQEQFYGCSDIAITSNGETDESAWDEGTVDEGTEDENTLDDDTASGSDGVVHTDPTTTTITTTTTTTTTTPAKPAGDCYAAGAWSGDANMDAWCHTNCAVGNCPATHCACGPSNGAPAVPACFAIGPWSGNVNFDTWCLNNCAMGYCPETHCACW